MVPCSNKTQKNWIQDRSQMLLKLNSTNADRILNFTKVSKTSNSTKAPKTSNSTYYTNVPKILNAIRALMYLM